MEVNAEFLQKEIASLSEQMKNLEASFQRLVGIKLYLEDLLKRLDQPVTEETKLES